VQLICVSVERQRGNPWVEREDRIFYAASTFLAISYRHTSFLIILYLQASVSLSLAQKLMPYHTYVLVYRQLNSNTIQYTTVY